MGKRRGNEPSERKSSPFPPEGGEGCGALKFKRQVGLEGKPKSYTRLRLQHMRSYFAPAPAGPGP